MCTALNHLWPFFGPFQTFLNANWFVLKNESHITLSLAIALFQCTSLHNFIKVWSNPKDSSLCNQTPSLNWTIKDLCKRSSGWIYLLPCLVPWPSQKAERRFGVLSNISCHVGWSLLQNKSSRRLQSLLGQSRISCWISLYSTSSLIQNMIAYVLFSGRCGLLIVSAHIILCCKHCSQSREQTHPKKSLRTCDPLFQHVWEGMDMRLVSTIHKWS